MSGQLYLAPVKGVTDRVFREAFSSHFRGLDITVAPFIISSDSDKKIKDLAPQKNRGIKTVPQILTKSPVAFLSIAKKRAVRHWIRRGQLESRLPVPHGAQQGGRCCHAAVTGVSRFIS